VAEGPEAKVRLVLDRILRDAGWLRSEIAQEQSLTTGRLDYRLADLCILEAKKPTRPDKPSELKLHLQQSQRHGRGADEVPFLMVSDGELHFLQDRRTGRIERVFAMPTKQQFQALASDEGALVDGYIVEPSSLFEFQREAIQTAVPKVYDGDRRLLLAGDFSTGVFRRQSKPPLARVTLEP
jgi:type I site-specific restriction endonuclease